jgi:excisionase family DNA binding protein
MFEDATPNPAPGYLTVRDAASRLSVTEDMVRKLIARGELEAARVGRDWMIPSVAVERRLATRPSRGRRLTPARAWGLLFLSVGQPVTWLDRHARWRLSRYLAEHRLEDLRGQLVERGRPKSYRAHPAMLKALRADPLVMITGIAAASELRLGLIGGEDRIEAYVDEARLDALIHRYHLRLSNDPNVVLRAIPSFGWSELPARIAPLPAVALDLLDDPEPRAQQTGSELLASIRP